MAEIAGQRPYKDNAKLTSVAFPIDCEYSPYTAGRRQNAHSLFLSPLLESGVRLAGSAAASEQTTVDALNQKSTPERWRTLALLMNPAATVAVRGQAMSYLQVLEKALQEAPDSRASNTWQLWRALGNYLVTRPQLTGKVNGAKYTAQTAYLEALNIEPHDAVAWTGLAMTLSDPLVTVTLRGVKMRRADCLEKSVALQRFRVGPE